MYDNVYFRLQTGSNTYQEIEHRNVIVVGHEWFFNLLSLPIEQYIDLIRESISDHRRMPVLLKKIGEIHPFYNDQWRAMRVIGETILSMQEDPAIIGEYENLFKKKGRFTPYFLSEETKTDNPMSLQALAKWQNHMRSNFQIDESMKLASKIQNMEMFHSESQWMISNDGESTRPFIYYNITSIQDILSIEACEIMIDKEFVRACTVCGKKFATTENDRMVCYTLAKKDTLSCLQKVKNEEAREMYRMAYRAHEQRKRRGVFDNAPYSGEELQKWKTEAKQAIQRYVKGEIDKKTYMEIMMSN